MSHKDTKQFTLNRETATLSLRQGYTSSIKVCYFNMAHTALQFLFQPQSAKSPIHTVLLKVRTLELCCMVRCSAVLFHTRKTKSIT